MSARPANAVSRGEVILLALLAAVLGALGGISGAKELSGREEAPRNEVRIVSVDVDALLGAFIAEQAAEGLEAAALQEATIEWSSRFQAVLEEIHQRHGVVVLTSASVAAGAEDLTEVVAHALR